MKAIKIDNYLYDPPSWKVCPECKDTARVQKAHCSNGDFETAGTVTVGYFKCQKCADSPLPGYLPIHYTPEEWEAAEGILTDETLCFAYDYVEWFPQEYQFVKGFEKVIIATSVGRPEEE